MKTPPKHPRKSSSLRNSQSNNLDSASTKSESFLKDKNSLGESESDPLELGGQIREERVVKRLNDKNYLYVPKDEIQGNDVLEKNEAIDTSEEKHPHD